MSMGDDFVNSFEMVFTDPGHANFGDYATALGSLVAVATGGAALYGAYGAGAGAAAGTGAAAGSAGAGAGVTGGAYGSLLSLTTPSALTMGGTTTLGGGTLLAGTSAAPTAAGVLGVSEGSGLLAALGSLVTHPGAALEAAAVTTGKVAAASAAAQSIMTPWQRAKEKVSGMLGLGGSSQPVAGGGGGVLPIMKDSGVVQTAGISPLLALGLAGAAVAALVYWWRNRK